MAEKFNFAAAERHAEVLLHDYPLTLAAVKEAFAEARRYRFLRPHLHVGDGGAVQVALNGLYLGNDYTGKYRAGVELDRALDKRMRER